MTAFSASIARFKVCSFVIMINEGEIGSLFDSESIEQIRKDTDQTKLEIESDLKAGWKMLFENAVNCKGFVAVIIGLVQYVE